MAIREITTLRTNRFDQGQTDGTSVSQKFSHTDSTPLSGIETNESYDYTVTLNGDTTALMKIRLVGETSLDYQTSVNNSVFIVSNHSSPYLNNPALTFYRGKTYRFIQTNANNVSQPLVFTESDGTTSYTDGVSTNSGTAGTDLITTFTVPQNAPNTLKYVSSGTGGTAYGNTITVADANTSTPKTKYAEIEVFHDEVESKILTDIGLSELTLTPTRAYDAGTGTTDFTLNIENDFQDAFFFSIYTEGYTYDKSVSGYSGGENTLTRLFGSRGVFGGGFSPPTVCTLDYITIATPGDAATFGELFENRYALAATSDGSRGVFGGGFAPTGIVSTLDYITIANDGTNATDFGDLFETRYGLAAVSDGSRGVFGGGANNAPAYVCTLDYITISTPGNATDFGDLTEARRYLTATSDGSRGVFGGGQSNVPPYVCTLDYITIASTPTVTATVFGALTEGREVPAATSDGSRGVFGGGDETPTSFVNTLDYITISTPGNATDFGDLTQPRNGLAATSDGSRGVFGGGANPTDGRVCTLDYITISTPGNAITFGALTEGRSVLTATSGD